MNIPLPELEPRLQKRYQKLVNEHLHTSEGNAAGSRALPSLNEAFASTQAAWRFYTNQDVTLPALVAPLHQQALQNLPKLCRNYGLVLHDWSDLPYASHTTKQDRKPLGSQLGYELATALLISDQTGQPIVPVSLSLWANDGWHTTLAPDVRRDLSPLDLTTETIFSLRQLDLQLPLVHILDREGDSIFHYRQWDEAGHLFVVRANDGQRVVSQHRRGLLREVVAEVELSACQAVEVASNLRGQLFVGETEVVIDRPAFPRTRRGKRRWIKGEALSLRLVVSQIRLPDETILAQWYLLSNVGRSVSTTQLVEWYYWRWRIESYFKLLKSHGFQVECWQQESVDKIGKRLLVAAMACVVVWQLQQATDTESVALRELLLRLSGRQVRRGQATAPALLGGLWILLAAIELLDHYDLTDLKQMARLAAPGYS